nr:Uncharacterised protein [Klebsiella pneumoniae]
MTTGPASFDYGPGEAMVIAADVPTTSQITEASQRFPITRWCWSWTGYPARAAGGRAVRAG